MRPALAAAFLLLAACQPQDPDGKAAAPPADAPAAAAPAAATPAAGASLDISQPITARGTEPFWALTITGGKSFKLSRPDHADILAEAPGAALSPGGATWVAQGTKGQQLTVTLKMSDCSDGMSDLKYPMIAEIVLLNETLIGCAAKTAELPREGS